MTTTERKAAANRSSGKSYREILASDTRDVPEVLLATGHHDVGPLEIPVEWYLSREVHEREKQRIWARRWQVACRVEDVPEVGDTWVYDVNELSVLVVRTAPERIKAFYNSCLHRGRPLRDYPGRANDLQCPFHGFTWNLDGTCKRIPCEWDFQHIDMTNFSLPELPVDTWGGFVFINPDPDAVPLGEYLGEIDTHFVRWPLEQRYKSVHVAKVINANWKLAQEAFMESYHTITTHPELLPSLGDANSQYDAFGNFSRAISAVAFPSPHMVRELTQQEIVDSALGKWEEEESLLRAPDGAAARPVLAAAIREQFRPALGNGVDSLCDAEMIDAIYYSLYPNLHPWGGYSTLITYRFRPYQDNHQRSIMECMFLSPYAGERPVGVPVHWLDDDEDWLAAPELGSLGHVFQQDMLNLEHMHRGLRNNTRKKVFLGRYQELKIRHFYSLYVQDMHLVQSDLASKGTQQRGSTSPDPQTGRIHDPGRRR
jgi:phenylpropionate dioxygenase-like ring-hydroxylating dioxygenase large terminal subunit